MSPTSQNKLIKIIRGRIIQKKIIEESKGAQYHSVLADKVPSSSNKIPLICIRYINKEKQIRKVFLDFMFLERISVECIGQTILNFTKKKVSIFLTVQGNLMTVLLI